MLRSAWRSLLLAVVALFVSLSPLAAQDREPVWIAEARHVRQGADMAHAVALTTDGAYVAVSTPTSVNTVRYDNSGRILWARRFPARASFLEVKIGPEGTAYVVFAHYLSGTSHLLKYAATGELLWSVDSHTTPLPVQLRDVAVDESGSAYLAAAGFSTLKFSSAGRHQWTRTYSTGTGEPAVAAVALDAAGNAYVTGASRDEQTADDFTTIKYAPDGAELWVRRFDSGAGTNDAAVDVAVYGDAIYVAGTVDRSFGGDITTVAYSADGDRRWVARRRGGTSDDSARRIAVDSEGNVVVFGSVTVDVTRMDLLTAKYDASGALLWDRPLDTGWQDVAVDMSISAADQVAVLGQRSSSDGLQTAIVVAVYSAAGGLRWTRDHITTDDSGREEQSGAVAIDAAGQTYVVGGVPRAETGLDAVTLLVDLTGTELWRRYHASSDLTGERVADAVVDREGNTYVVGGGDGLLTAKVTSEGRFAWVARFGPTRDPWEAVAARVDSAGRVYVLASRSKTYSLHTLIIVSYDSEGKNRWVFEAGDSLTKDPTIMAAEPGGGAVLSRVWGDNLNQPNLITTRLRADGTEQWTAVLQRVPAGAAPRVAVVDDMHAYVSFGTPGPASRLDFGTIRYGASGRVSWFRRYDYAFGADFPIASAVDGAGNLIVTGSGQGSAGTDFLTISYTPAGELRWTARYNGSGSGNDRPVALAVQEGEGAAVLGLARMANGATVPTVVRYDARGRRLWVAGISSNTPFVNGGVAISTQGHVVITGNGRPPGLRWGWLTRAYGQQGEQLWSAHRTTGAITGSLTPPRLGVAPDGSIRVAGSLTSPAGVAEMSVVKYGP